MVNEHGLLPPWAVGNAHGVLMIGAQLPTKDGRKVGNSFIIGGVVREGGHITYTVMTEAGNQLDLTSEEIRELYHDPEYFCDLNEITKRFYRSPS